MAYRIVTLVSSGSPADCVDEERVRRLAEPFGARDVRAFESGTSLDFRLPFDEGGECYVEVDVTPELIDWYASKFEAETGGRLEPMPNVFASWTVSDAMNLDLMHDVADAVMPGEVVTAWDDIAGFGVRWR